VSEVKGAARRTDLINHGKMKGKAMGKIANIAVDAAKTGYTIYKIAKVGSLALGPAGWGAFLLSWGVEYLVSKAIEKGVEYYVSKKHTGQKEIATGSDNIFVNNLEAARGNKRDKVSCCGNVTEQGSQWVSFNKKPAARLEDATKCPGNISSASKNVGIGGPPTEFDPHAALDAISDVLSLFNGMKKGLTIAGKLGTPIGKTVGGEIRDTVIGKGLDKAADGVLGW